MKKRTKMKREKEMNARQGEGTKKIEVNPEKEYNAMVLNGVADNISKFSKAHINPFEIPKEDYIVNAEKLVAILDDNNMIDASNELVQILSHVKVMNQKVDQMTIELTEVKELLKSLQLQKSPLISTYSEVVDSMQANADYASVKLQNIKVQISQQVGNSINKFKEKGVETLHKTLSFLHVKESLQKFDKGIDIILSNATKNIKKVEDIAQEADAIKYHTGNMKNIILNRQNETNQPQEKQQEGKIIKLFKAPLFAQISHMSNIKQTIAKALGSLENLEQSVQDINTSKDTSPKVSVFDKLKKASESKQVPKEEKTLQQPFLAYQR